MHVKSLQQAVVISVCAFVVTACGGDSEEEKLTRAPKVNMARPIDGPLTNTGAEQFIKNGIYAASIAEGGTTDDAVSPSLAMSASDDFSRTNTVVQGVDEADRIKYDGNMLYLAEYSQWQGDDYVTPKVRVLKRQADDSLSEFASIEAELDFDVINGLYLSDERLAVIGSDHPIYTLATASFAPWEPLNPSFTVSIYGVDAESMPTSLVNMTVDGALLDSRRIDDKLYVISSYVPHVDNLTPGAEDEQSRLANYLAVAQTPNSQLMPKMHRDGQSLSLNQMQECLVPQNASSQDGFAQILTITRIDLTAPTQVESICMSVYAYLTYVSQENLYLVTQGDQHNTLLHKIALHDLSYQASGKVHGVLGWRGNPLFRLDEHQGKLRIVSTDYTGERPIHQLTVLDQQGDQLSELAKLPNQSAPEAIGKPGEDIYAVRFVGDTAYIVTFENIDPLYVLNLADPQQPFIEGALEIPGFSSYLHPLENDLLLGIGQQVDVTQIPQDGSIPTEPPVTSGMKVSLFDVRDPAQPKTIASIVEPFAYTPVEYNYKALSVLNVGGKYQFALPFESWNSEGIDGYFLPETRLMRLEVDTNSSEPQLQLVDKTHVEVEQSSYVYSGDDRSILHPEFYYYVRGNLVWKGVWSDAQLPTGPF